MPSFQHSSAMMHNRDDGAGAPIAALRTSASTGRQWDGLTRYLTMRLADGMRSATHVEIADSGHMVPLTDPHKIDPAIAAHILHAERDVCGRVRSEAVAA